jgi:hypothetical protein
MSFARRIRLFIIGILIGSLVVWGFLFRGRTFPAWTPEGRVLEALQEHPIRITSEARCMLNCNKISDEDILALIADGDVLFSESDIRGKDIPEYVVEGKGKNQKLYKMKFRTEYLTTVLISVLPSPNSNATCDCK